MTSETPPADALQSPATQSREIAPARRSSRRSRDRSSDPIHLQETGRRSTRAARVAITVQEARRVNARRSLVNRPDDCRKFDEWRPDAAFRQPANRTALARRDRRRRARGSAAHRRAASADLARRQLGYGRGRRMAIEQDRRDPGRRAARAHARQSDRAAHPQPRLGELAAHDERRSRPARIGGRRGETSSRGRGPVTPTSPAGSSTATPICATSSNARAPAKPPRGLRPARSHERCSAGMASKRQATSSRSVRRPSTIRWRSRSPGACPRAR